MTDDERATLIARLDRIEEKMDQVLEFRNMILTFVTAGAAKKAAMMAKAKVMGQ